MNHSKQKVIDAATSLFFQKGFHGTSVRDIAESASVNVSLISYYFKNKQGLLEYTLIEYYETYLQYIEQTIEQTASLSKIEQLKELVITIVQYKQDNLQLSSIIHRELSLQSIFVKEMTVTYLSKENYYLKTLLFDVLQKKHEAHKEYLFMQLKGMLITPYVLHNEWKHQIIDNYSHQLFVEKYTETIHFWIDSLK